MTATERVPRQRTNGTPRANGHATSEPRPFGPQPTPPPTPTNSGPPTVVPATVPEFMNQLQAMRAALGLSYSQIGARAGNGFLRSTAARVLKDVDTLIEPKHLKLFLKACKVTPAEQARWLRARDLVSERATANTATTATDLPETTGDTTDTADSEEATTQPAPPVQTDNSPEPVPVKSEDPSPAPARRTPTMAIVRAVLALSALVTIITGSTVAMWVTGVPTEVIITAYGLVIVCVTAWLAVARMAINATFDRQHRYGPPSVGPGAGAGPTGRNLVQGDPEIFDIDERQVVPPIIGMDPADRR